MATPARVEARCTSKAQGSHWSEIPPKVHILDPWLARHFASASLLLRPSQPDIPYDINTSTTESYGPPSAYVGFRLGNGGAGYTGLLRKLSEAFIDAHEETFRIEWVSNHSRFTQVALLADVVQVALTYEPEWEDLSIAEGWADRITGVFNDGFVLAGSRNNPAGVGAGSDIRFALQDIARYGCSATSPRPVYHSRHDGSATHYKELQLWGLAGVDLATSGHWRLLIPSTPYEALVRANQDGVYVLTDRATFLTAQRDNAISNLVVFAERSPHLVNPCSALVNLKAPRNGLAIQFAHWLGSSRAQDIVTHYGDEWLARKPTFAGKDDQVIDAEYALM